MITQAFSQRPLLLFCLLSLTLGARVLWGEDTPSASSAKIQVAVTVHPLAAIVTELVGDRATVLRLLPPSASPHTYSPRPADVAAAEKAAVLFYVGDALDGWASRFPAARRVAVFPMVPRDAMPEGGLPNLDTGHDHEHEHADDDGTHAGLDPHFWMDPLLVKAALPGIVAVLKEIDPEGADTYDANAERFQATLDGIDAEAERLLAPFAGRAVVLFHPSMNYLLHRHGLRVVATVEPFPGKAPNARYVRDLSELVRREGVLTLYTEPQLNRRSAEVVAEAAGVGLAELDPNGGIAGRRTYAELILYNCRTLNETLNP